MESVLDLNQKNLRLFKGRSSKGIKGIKLNDKDKVISLSILDNTNISSKSINKNKKIKNGIDNFIFQFLKMVMENDHLIWIME